MKGHEKIQITDGKITVAGNNAEYREGLIRTIHGEIDSLRYYAGYSALALEKSDLVSRAQFRGIARFKKDSFSIIENEDFLTKTLPVTIEIAPNAEHKWSANIGFLEYDIEIGHGPEWFLTCYVTPECFNAILHAYKNDLIAGMGLMLGGTLWAHHSDQYAHPRDPVKWYLLPQKYGASLGQTYLSALNWTYGEVAKATPSDDKSEITDFARFEVQETPPSPPTADILLEVPKLLKAIFVGLILVASAIFFK